jgi:hypothetical protein
MVRFGYGMKHPVANVPSYQQVIFSFEVLLLTKEVCNPINHVAVKTLGRSTSQIPQLKGENFMKK